MKKIISISVILMIIGLIALIKEKIDLKNWAINNTETLPTFSFLNMKSNTFNKDNIVIPNEKIIFNFFSPSCEHCQYMAVQYFQHKEQLRNISILMVTNADSAATVSFIKNYRLREMPNITILRDTKFQFPKIFGTSVVPSFFIYNHQKLVKKIIGETKIENLLTL